VATVTKRTGLLLTVNSALTCARTTDSPNLLAVCVLPIDIYKGLYIYIYVSTTVPDVGLVTLMIIFFSKDDLILYRVTKVSGEMYRSKSISFRSEEHTS